MPLAIERILRSKYYPTLPQVFSILVFLAILFFAFAGNPHGDTNFAVAVTWYLWWVLLPFSAVVFGRIWCSFCPLSTISRFILRLRKKRGRIGRISTPGYGIWVSGLLLLFLTWAMIAWRIEAMPAATGLLLLAFLAGALGTGLLYDERTWCRSFCPIGTIIGLYSRLAPLQLRPKETTCTARCGRSGSCHAFLLSEQCLVDGPISQLRSNRDCSLCGDCVKSCRHSSVEVRFRWPEALTARSTTLTAAEAVVLLLLVSVVLLDLLRMTSWYPLLMKRLVIVAPVLDYNAVLALVMLALVASVFALYLLMSWLSAGLSGRPVRESFVSFVSPYVAIAAAAHLGSEVFHLVSHGTHPLLAIGLELGFAVEFPAVVRGAVYVQNPALQTLEITLLLIATALAVRAFWKASTTAGANGLRRGVLAASQVALSTLIAAAAAFLFISPMGLIH